MTATFLTVLVTALGLLIVDLVVPGVDLANFPAALIGAVAIGLINGSVKPILSALSLPLNIVSLGAFSLIVNGICFSLAAFLVPGFSVHGILGFLIGPVVLAFATTFINNYFAERNLTLKSSDDVKPKTELPSS